MGTRRALVLLAVLATCAAALLAGCGGEGDSTSSTQTQSRGAGAPASQGAFTAKPHHDSGGGAEQFVVKGGDNSIQEFGEEGSEAQLHEAAIALHGFLDARAARDWAAACSYLAPNIAKSLQQLAAASPEFKGAGCPELLASLSKGVPAATLAEAAQADVGSLRSEGERAFLIYRGAGKSVYAISMEGADGEWKVGALSGTPLN